MGKGGTWKENPQFGVCFSKEGKYSKDMCSYPLACEQFPSSRVQFPHGTIYTLKTTFSQMPCIYFHLSIYEKRDGEGGSREDMQSLSLPSLSLVY